jgi:hypothetical protein
LYTQGQLLLILELNTRPSWVHPEHIPFAHWLAIVAKSMPSRTRPNRLLPWRGLALTKLPGPSPIEKCFYLDINFFLKHGLTPWFVTNREILLDINFFIKHGRGTISVGVHGWLNSESWRQSSWGLKTKKEKKQKKLPFSPILNFLFLSYPGEICLF